MYLGKAKIILLTVVVRSVYIYRHKQTVRMNEKLPNKITIQRKTNTTALHSLLQYN